MGELMDDFFTFPSIDNETISIPFNWQQWSGSLVSPEDVRLQNATRQMYIDDPALLVEKEESVCEIIHDALLARKVRIQEDYD